MQMDDMADDGTPRLWTSPVDPFRYPNLKPGRWFQVTEIVDDMVSLEGVVGPLHESMLRFQENEPIWATVIPDPPTLAPKEPRESDAMMRWRAVCPKGHDMGEIDYTATSGVCKKCGTWYETAGRRRSSEKP